MKPLLTLSTILLCLNLFAQTAQNPPAAPKAEDYSGTYSFLPDGEVVPLNIEDGNNVTGYISRYGDGETDRGLFLEHFFKEGKLDGKKLSFSTKAVHGVSYDFKGTVKRTDGKKPSDEGYYVLKGTLIQTNVDSQQKATTKSRDVVFKSFPQDLGDAPDKK